MNQPLTLSALLRPLWHDFRRAWDVLVVFELLLQLIKAWLLVPAIAAVLSAVLSRAGHVAVSNDQILDVLLSPVGLISAALFVVVSAAFFLVEQAGIMALVAAREEHARWPMQVLLGESLTRGWRVGQMGSIKVGWLALSSAPFVLLAALTYGVLLTQHDIYFYLKDRPPVFWFAAVIGAALCLAALSVGLALFIRWSLALPILLFEDQSPAAALRTSRERVHGARWQIGGLLLGWLLGMLLLGTALATAFRFISAAVLERVSDDRSLIAVVLLVIAQGAFLAAWSFVTNVGQVLLTRRLYLLRSQQLGVVQPAPTAVAPETGAIAAVGFRPLAYVCGAIILLSPLAMWWNLSQQLSRNRPTIGVTAHRGHARRAPENTLIAIQKAIDSGADYVEVDVHQTADGVVALLHDRDLKRVAGVSRRLDELTYDEVQAFDVGSWFDPAFAAERVPTLQQAINLCRGRIKMNIELKVFDSNHELARRVARVIQEQDFESECLVTSLNYQALLEVKQQNPRQRTGIIIAQALGDVSRLRVEILSVRANHLSDDMLHAAHRNQMEVHAWTVNDANQMTRLIKRGVDNIITSDPDLAIRVRDKWVNLSDAERLIVASRLLLGLAP